MRSTLTAVFLPLIFAGQKLIAAILLIVGALILADVMTNPSDNGDMDRSRFLVAASALSLGILLDLTTVLARRLRLTATIGAMVLDALCIVFALSVTESESRGIIDELVPQIYAVGIIAMALLIALLLVTCSRKINHPDIPSTDAAPNPAPRLSPSATAPVLEYQPSRAMKRPFPGGMALAGQIVAVMLIALVCSVVVQEDFHFVSAFEFIPLLMAVTIVGLGVAAVFCAWGIQHFRRAAMAGGFTIAALGLAFTLLLTSVVIYQWFTSRPYFSSGEWLFYIGFSLSNLGPLAVIYEILAVRRRTSPVSTHA